MAWRGTTWLPSGPTTTTTSCCSGANDLATIKDRLDRAETDWEYVSRDPTEIRVLGLADEMAIVIAADLRVLDVER